MSPSQTRSPDSTLFDGIPFDPVEARRENAGKSAGQNSPDGKARKNGLCAQDDSITATMPGDHERILESYNRDFRPSGVLEEMLVRELALADWRLSLIARMESGFLSFHMQVLCEEETPGVNVDQHQNHDVSALMGIAWFNNQNLLALLVRYQNQARRAYYRALKELGLIRSGKANYLPQPSGKPAECETKPPEQAKTAKSGPGNETKPGPRTFTVTSRVLPPETGAGMDSSGSRSASAANE